MLILFQGFSAQIDSTQMGDSTIVDTIQPVVFTFTEPPFTLTPSFYKNRYQEED